MEDLGTLAAVRLSDCAVVDRKDAFLCRNAAQAALGRRPDYEDDHVVSWGRLTVEDAALVLELETDASAPAEIRKELNARVASLGRVEWTLFYADSTLGY